MNTNLSHKKTTTIVLGKTINLLDLTENDSSPKTKTVEIEYEVVNVDVPSKPLILEVRQDPWEKTNSYTFEEFKEWYGDEFGEIVWELAELDYYKEKHEQHRLSIITLKKLQKKQKKLIKQLKQQIKDQEYNLAFSEYEKMENEWHNNQNKK